MSTQATRIKIKNYAVSRFLSVQDEEVFVFMRKLAAKFHSAGPREAICDAMRSRLPVGLRVFDRVDDNGALAVEARASRHQQRREGKYRDHQQVNK